MENYIEIVVTKLRTRYKASCPLFPECKGIGPTEEKALLQLSRAISKFIGKLSNDNLSKLFLSERYTEVILDSTKPDKTHHKVFHLDRKQSGSSFFLKYKGQLPSQLPHNRGPAAADVKRLLSQLDEIVIAQGDTTPLGAELLLETDPSDLIPLTEDGLAFGFLLNMN